MIDPGAAQAVVKQLNRWYRKRAKPQGIIDHYHRGTRLCYTSVNRAVAGGFSSLLLSIAVLLYFVPSVTADKSFAMVLFLKTAWLGIVVLAILAPLQAFREFVVVTDDCLIKSDLFGRETRMAWKDIFTCQIKPDDNKVIFKNIATAKLTMSLSYDGWQDFQEVAARRLNPVLYWQFHHTLATLHDTGSIPRPAKKMRWPEWFSYGRKHS